ncbi:hypothetical protein G9A89_021062 [Geosiphon pyriformis]|nr:hypothetical protein G9A89_021062 [Geosiphon pyriformis]
MIYTISEEEKPINNCGSESESFNLNSNSNPKTYIVLSDLSKKRKFRWFSDSNKDIMPECTHNTNAEFDLRYPEKDAIKLKLYLCICIDLKIVLEIPATTMVQLASRNSLAKRGINIRGGIIDTKYVKNIIAMLQNDSKKTYIIEPNEKIAQAIFLLLCGCFGHSVLECDASEVLPLVSSELLKRPSLGVNCLQLARLYAKKNVPLSRPTVFGGKSWAQVVFSASSSGGFPFSSDIIKIPKRTIIEHLITEIEDQLPDTIPDFSQLCRYVDITSQTIYGRKECYLLQPEQLEQINLRNLDPLQQMQLKMLLNNFNDIFASKNEFGRTDIIQHQIKTGDAMSIKQRAYRVPPANHEIIHQEINQMFDNRLIQLSMSP